MLELRRRIKELYEKNEGAQEFFSCAVLCSVLFEKYGLDLSSPAPTDAVRAAVLSDAARLLAGEPWQYYLGECEFFGRKFFCRENVLIPRFDTELLVHLALEALPEDGVFYDFCTGSGAIAVTLLCERPEAIGIAVDVSDDALTLARDNAVRHEVLHRVLLRKRDLLCEPGGSKQADVLCMNPPYIRTAVLKDLPPNVLREPMLALDGGEDGLIFYRRVLSRLSEYVREGGTALFEIGFDQSEDVLRLCRAYGYDAVVLKDDEERDRVVKINVAKTRNT